MLQQGSLKQTHSSPLKAHLRVISDSDLQRTPAELLDCLESLGSLVGSQMSLLLLEHSTSLLAD